MGRWEIRKRFEKRGTTIQTQRTKQTSSKIGFIMFFPVRGFIYKVFAILGAGRQREEKNRYINTVYRFLPTLQNANGSKKIKENNRVGFNSGALLEALAWRL